MRQQLLGITMVILATFAGLTTSAAAEPTALPMAAVSAEKLALARTIVEASLPPQRRAEQMRKMIDATLAPMRAYVPSSMGNDRGLNKMMKDYFREVADLLKPQIQAFFPKQIDATVGAYARQFSEQELRGIVAFSKTPSGRAYFERSIDVLSDPAIAALKADYFAQSQKTAEKQAAEVNCRMQAYLKQHPDVAAALSKQRAGAQN